MPVYDYKCREHGLFNDLATLAESGNPIACPTCGELSPRVIVMSPNIPLLDENQRKAHERNERAAHEPCHSAQYAERAKPHLQKKHHLIYTADGKKMFPSMRPWMISH